jgi:restriction system protein
MARRGGFISALNKIAREAAREARRQEAAARRNARETEAATRRSQRDFERHQRDRQRAGAVAAKEAKALYLEQREHEVEALNEVIEEKLADLGALLQHTLGVDDALSFETLRIPRAFPPFLAPVHLANPAKRVESGAHLAAVAAPSFWIGWLPWVRSDHARRLAEARSRDEDASRNWEIAESERRQALEQATRGHERSRSAHEELADARNREVDAFRAAYRSGQSEAIIAYNSMVLERSVYPEDLDVGFELGYMEDARELVVEFHLPTKDCVPGVVEHKYVKARDAIEAKPRRTAEVRAVYREAIASLCLRTVHEVFEADQHEHVRTVVFNGSVCDADPSTGQDVKRCLVALRANREVFVKINLHRVEKLACVEGLDGRLSLRPDELLHVEPVAPYGTGDGIVELEEEPPARPRQREKAG